ncbi:MAG: hypothetical protein K2N65_02275 [Anaeroplasmataceae bacterium]|nr:hypothetical protein [Anaeroplasmataceae bacterium]
MYIPANDNELLYLIRDGNGVAYRILFNKYEYLIAKLYKENNKIKHFVYLDYKQECLMCLENAIQSFQENHNSTFYSYFLLLVRRRTSNLLRTTHLQFKEHELAYNESYEQSRRYTPYLISTILKQLNLVEEYEYDLFYECLLNQKTIMYVAQKHHMDYQHIYIKYKKMKERVQKLLTNASV